MGQVMSWLNRISYFKGLFSVFSRKSIENVSRIEARKLFEYPQRLTDKSLRKKYTYTALCNYSVVDSGDPVKQEIQEKIINGGFGKQESRAIGCFVGMVTGDALGAPLEFSDVVYNSICLRKFDDLEYFEYPFNRFDLKPGQWTDDSSMGLCLAESLLCFPDFNPIDLRIRFLNWWDFGYRNAFAKTPRSSVGLGGCISMSFTEFMENCSEYTTSGDENTSGNGSIMRLAAVPIFYHDDLDKALDIAFKQSKTTHQGTEAAECCRLMTYIIISFINSSIEDCEIRKQEVLRNLSDNFHTECYSVQCLASSKNEETHSMNKNLKLKDRQWNWMLEDFRYASSRAYKQPGYIGSYCMDALAMSLHCIWTTNSFNDAVLKAINLRGDSDTVGAITGQIAGALYGIEHISQNWIQTIQQWDNGGDIALTAHKLFIKENIQ